MASLWEETWRPPEFPRLEGDVDTHVLVVGGGMAGVLCAYFLHRAGVPYVLAEADTIGSGITKNTTAKITSQHGLIYHQLVRRWGGGAGPAVPGGPGGGAGAVPDAVPGHRLRL